MLQNIQVFLILVISAVIVTALPPGNFSLLTARKGVNLPGNARPFFNSWKTFCEDNKVPHDTWFIDPNDCKSHLVCYYDENRVLRTFYLQCHGEGEWAVLGPRNTDGGCAVPEIGEICPYDPIFWPPGTNENYPPPGNFSLSTARKGTNLPGNARPFFNSWDTFCEDNNVPHDTWFIDPNNCENHLVCYDDEDGVLGTYFLPCPAGQWAVLGPQNTDGDCAWPEPGEICPYDPIFWPPGDMLCPPPGSNELVFLPSEYFCNHFYVCINGNPIQQECRPGQHWNANRNFCDDPSRAGCDLPNGPPVLPDCPIGETQSLPFPGDCNLFIFCQRNGNRSVQRCPHLQYFDVKYAVCMDFRNAICLDSVRGNTRSG